MEKRRRAGLMAAVLVSVLLTGCNVQDKPAGSSGSVTQTVPVSSEALNTGESEPETQPPEEVQSSENESSGEAVSTAESSDSTRQSGQTYDASGSAEAVYSAEETVTESGGPDTPVQGSSKPPETSSSVEVVTSAAPQTTAATSATAPPEPVQVVIPNVKVPLSPGTDIACCDNAVLDYSNAADGYISVCWNDTGKLVKLRLTYGDKVYDHDVSTGGVTEYFPLSCGSGTYKAQLYEQTEGDRFRKALEIEFPANIRKETTPFLYPNKYVDFRSGSASVKKAAELCAGKTDTIEKLAAIFQWITDNVTYDKQLAATVQSGYVPDPDSVLKKKTGICYDYSSLLAAMTRSQGIPTRLVVGYAATNIYHAWNEVYTDETGWITPELLLAKKGYNIMDSTFYAGSSDKEKIADYISNSGNYAALYYY